MKKGLNYWSFPGGIPGEKPLAEAARETKQHGYDAIELAMSANGELTPRTSDDDVKRIADAVRAEGVEIASLASVLTWDAPLTSADASVRGKSVDLVTRGLETARLLGTDCFLVIPGAVDIFFNPDEPVVPYDLAYENLRACLDKLVPVAEKNQVAIGLENVWNRFLLSPLEVRDLVDGYASDYLGVYFDTGNVLLTGYPEQWIRILGKRIKRVHFKDFSRAIGTAAGFVDLLEGDVDWPGVMKSLREVGYDSYCTAELIPTYKFGPEVRCRNASVAMDRIFAM